MGAVQFTALSRPLCVVTSHLCHLYHCCGCRYIAIQGSTTLDHWQINLKASASWQ